MGIRKATTRSFVYPRPHEMVNKTIPCVLDDTIDASLQVTPEVFGFVFLAQESHKGLEIVGEMLHSKGVITWASVIKEGTQGNVKAEAAEYAWSTVSCMRDENASPNIQFHSHGSMSAFFSGEDTGDIESRLDAAIDAFPSGEFYFVVVGSFGCEWIVRRYVWESKIVRYNQGHVKYGPIVLDKTFGQRLSSTTQVGTQYVQQSLGYNANGTSVVKYVNKEADATAPKAPKAPMMYSGRRYAAYSVELLDAAFALVSAKEADGQITKEQDEFLAILKTSGSWSMVQLGHKYSVDPVIEELVSETILSAVVTKGEIDKAWSSLCKTYFEGDPLEALSYLDDVQYVMLVELEKLAKERKTALIRDLLTGGSEHQTCFADIALSMVAAITNQEALDIIYEFLFVEDVIDIREEYISWVLESKIGPSALLLESDDVMIPWLEEARYGLTDAEGATLAGRADAYCDGATGIALVALFKALDGKSAKSQAVHEAAAAMPGQRRTKINEEQYVTRILGLCGSSKPMEMVALLLELGKMSYQDYIAVHNAVVTSKKDDSVSLFAKGFFSGEHNGVMFLYLAWLVAMGIDLGQKKDGEVEAIGYFREAWAIANINDVAHEYRKWLADYGFPSSLALQVWYDVVQYDVVETVLATEGGAGDA